MIKFFRKIRQNLLMENKTGKYFKYAIGEIVLVVIGILIALQINNWNEDRKNQIEEKAILSKFKQDLKSDSIYYQVNLKQIISIDSLHRELFLVGFNQKATIDHTKPSYIRRSLVYSPVARENDPNITNKINDEKIREEIKIYFRSMSEVYGANEEFEKVIFEIRAFLRQNKSHNVKSWFNSEMLLTLGSEVDEIITETNLIDLAKNEDFQQLVFESSLKINETKQRLTKLIDENSMLIAKVDKYLNRE